MTGTQIFLWCLFSYGVAYVIGHSKISLPFREWLSEGRGIKAWVLDLIECPGCLGIHIGFWFGLFYDRLHYAFNDDLFYNAVFLSFFTCSSNLLIHLAFVGDDNVQ